MRVEYLFSIEVICILIIANIKNFKVEWNINRYMRIYKNIVI